MSRTTKVLATIAILMFVTATTVFAQWGGINSSSPRRMVTPEEGSGTVPSQKNPEAVILGKLGVIENAPQILADGSKNPRLFVNESPKVVQSAVDNNHSLAMKELNAECETLKQLRGTAVNASEREQVLETAAQMLTKADEAKTPEEREFWMKKRSEELSRLPAQDDMAATIAPATEESDKGPLFWILMIGCPIILVTGAVVAVVLYRRNAKKKATSRRQRGSRGKGGSEKKGDDIVNKSS